VTRPAQNARLLGTAFVAAALGACAATDDSARTPADSAVVSDSAPAGSVQTFGTVAPFDDAARDTSFLTFRDALLRTLAQRDTASLYAIVAPDIRVSFGPDNGIGAFREEWRPGEDDSEIWSVLDDLLRHGGRFTTPDLFIAPWTFFGLSDSLDAFEYLVVRDSGVIVRAAPDASAAVLARLSFEIVRAASTPAPEGWTAIMTGDGRLGYVDADRVRSPVGYRAGFERRDGRWLLVFLAAGD
jgi:hypothetical protein